MDDPGSSFEDAFRAEYPSIVRVIAPIVGSVDDAEAITQDAFLKAFTRWRRIGRYDRPGTWVRRVAIRDAVRVAGRNRRTPSRLDTFVEHPSDAAAHLDLQSALGQLPPRQRACVVLHYLADWPASDVAVALGCSEATVRVHLHRARTSLAASLEPEPTETIDGR